MGFPMKTPAMKTTLLTMAAALAGAAVVVQMMTGDASGTRAASAEPLAGLAQSAGELAAGVGDGLARTGDVFSIAALADEAPVMRRDVSHLLRVEDTGALVDPGVSLQPLSTAVVTKIGYGRASEVRIVTTSSGVYSSDGLASPHVLYPGIHHSGPDGSGEDDFKIHALVKGSWASLAYTRAKGDGSFVTFGAIRGGGSFITGDGGTCVRGRGYSGCN